MELIVIAGLPATGKSTLAKTMQAEFGFPIIEKDGIKEQLFDTLGFKNYAEKRQLDVASNAALMYILKELAGGDSSAIVVNNFSSDAALAFNEFLTEHRVNCATVFLNGDPQVLYERYFERDCKGRRHLGHAMQKRYPPDPDDPEVFDMTREGFDERFLKLGMDKIGWNSPVRYEDGTYPGDIDVCAVISWVKETLGLP